MDRPTRRTFSLVRIVAMLTRMIERGSQFREANVVDGYVNENGNEGPSGQPQDPSDSQ